VDVGHNQLAWKIRTDARVKVYEKVNARSLPSDLLGEKVGIVVMDVSFISVKKILPALLPHADEGADFVVLIKPQFEVGREGVGKGGIVRDEALRAKAVEEVTLFAGSIGLKRAGLLDSPIEGADGNREYLAWFKNCQCSPPETGK
jgi:23S rRNA (cytidine1920-2'-O)/16S rRNA (cytidine1409-2'-O)-methyltransferase